MRQWGGVAGIQEHRGAEGDTAEEGKQTARDDGESSTRRPEHEE
jgi:hypothetical protein